MRSPRRWFPRALAVGALLLAATRADAAHSPWTVFDAVAGLAANRVQAIARDGDGGLLIGTDRGLSRFDGAAWTTWKAVDGLPDDDVRGVAVDPGGRIWVAAGAGFGRLENGLWSRVGAPRAKKEKAVHEMSTGKHLRSTAPFFRDYALTNLCPSRIIANIMSQYTRRWATRRSRAV